MLTVDCYDGPGRGIPLTSVSIYGRFWAASHIVTINIPQEWLPCLLTSKSRAKEQKDGLIPNKTFKICNGICSLMTRCISCNQIR